MKRPDTVPSQGPRWSGGFVRLGLSTFKWRNTAFRWDLGRKIDIMYVCRRKRNCSFGDKLTDLFFLIAKARNTELGAAWNRRSRGDGDGSANTTRRVVSRASQWPDRSDEQGCEERAHPRAFWLVRCLLYLYYTRGEIWQDHPATLFMDESQNDRDKTGLIALGKERNIVI